MTMYGIYKNGQFTECVGNVVFSDTVFQSAESLTDEQRIEFDVYHVADYRPELQPLHRYNTEYTYRVDGRTLVRTCGQSPIPDDEVLESVITAVQLRLDSFAKERNYDGIMSACTYAVDPNPIFNAEGQYCVAARSSTWAACYAILAQVKTGARTMPTVEQVMSELPTLTWPQ